MNTDLVERAMQIVEDAVDLPDGEQQEFLERACGNDLTLLREVESMLVFDSGISIEAPTSDDELEDALCKLSSASDRYELGEEIGRGGMGTVFRAHDRQLDREVAIKVLRKGANRSSDMHGRFAVEAQIGARLQHPGIAPVYDLGRLPDGRAFFAMKLVAGETLSSLLTARTDPMDDRSRLLAVFEQLCQTIAYAHSQGIIHRDLKPDNVMVGEFGEVQVMDWGLAKVISHGDTKITGNATVNDEHDCPQSSSPGWSPLSASETHVGIVMGTPAYMPPEQACGKRGKPTDVFSLGAILCEVLTGAPPYVAESPAEVYDKSAHADLHEARARLLDCQADPELIDLANECLKADSKDRPRDAGEVAHRISGYLQTVQTRLREAEVASARSAAIAVEERKRRRVTVALLATALALITLGLGGWMWISGQRARQAEERAQQAQDAARRQAAVAQLLNEAKTDAIRFQQVAVDAPLDDFAAWARARAAISEAEAILTTNTVPAEQSEEVKALSRQIRQQEANRKLLADIERAREKATMEISRPNEEDIPYPEQRRMHLEEVFRENQLHSDHSSQAECITFLNEKDERIGEELIGALDEWMVLCDVESDREWIAGVTGRVDTNPWRTAWRKAVLARDADELIALVSHDHTMNQPPRSVINLYLSLKTASPGFDATATLERLYPIHPGDFWLNYTLGNANLLDGDRNVPLRYYSAALRMRQISSLHRQIGMVLAGEVKSQEAIYHLRRALELNPQSGLCWETLAMAYTQMGRFDEAESAYSHVLELRPNKLQLAIYAEFLYKTKHAERAIEILREAQSPVGTNSLFLRDLLVVYLSREQAYLEAASVFQQPAAMWRTAESGYAVETRVKAAICAIKAADGQGVGASELSDEERGELRQLAHGWLRYSLELWLARRANSRFVLNAIVNARDSGELASVYAPLPLESLSSNEQKQWRLFWFNVDEAQRQLAYVDPDVRDLSAWTVLEPTMITSDQEATFERLSDGSFLVSGPNVERDIYSITTDLDLTGVTAVRLDVIADDRLPKKGPGRHETGNFHLAEIVLEVSDNSASNGKRSVPFTRAWATYSWDTRPVNNAIDGNTESVWHVWERLGKSHSAIFYLTEPLAAADAKNLTIRLIQGGENTPATLGRFRLSVRGAE